MPQTAPVRYDALLVVSFGGPDRREEVLPFLENVLRGRDVPRERLLEVAEHYYHFGGASPINEQNRTLVRAIEADFAAHGLALPVYWGNRNWHPLLPDVLKRMARDGVRRAAAFVTSAFGSYSGCRQYLENLAAAQAEVGPAAPAIDKLRVCFNHPGFIEAMTDRVREALARSSGGAAVIFTAHSIPQSMAAASPYVAQLTAACGLVSQSLNLPDWRLAYQSRSGPPMQPWLEPDVGEVIEELAGQGVKRVVVAPIGFISDHMEVLYDLDTETRALCDGLGVAMSRDYLVTIGIRK